MDAGVPEYDRLIPACAGTTERICLYTRRNPAHPRLRGDHFYVGLTVAVMMGSSPPARGPLSWSFLTFWPGRLIPACAGTTAWARLVSGVLWAHPRLRGDHFTTLAGFTLRQGSSPPARGPRPAPRRRPLPRRLIPACAGTTWHGLAPARRGRAHPRLRGDHPDAHAPVGTVTGSSPPARGPRLPVSVFDDRERLIPACAGTTRRTIPRRGIHPAHPRLRGDHPGAPSTSSVARGSSPPARGPPRSLEVLHFSDRLIPACAGTTGNGILNECA